MASPIEILFAEKVQGIIGEKGTVHGAELHETYGPGEYAFRVELSAETFERAVRCTQLLGDDFEDMLVVSHDTDEHQHDICVILDVSAEDC